MSRLIDHGPDEVTLWPEIEVRDAYDTPIRSGVGDPITLHVHLHRAGSREAELLGQSVEDTYFFNTSRRLPAHAFAKARVWGRDAQVVGTPQWQGRTARTGHTHVILTLTEPDEAAPSTPLAPV